MRKSSIPFKKGDQVTGLPGESCDGWHGTVDSIKEGETYYVPVGNGREEKRLRKYPNTLVCVYWKERANCDKSIDHWQKIQSQPIICMCPEKLRFQDGKVIDWSGFEAEKQQQSAAAQKTPTTSQTSLLEPPVEPEPPQREIIRLVVAGCRWYQDYEHVCQVLDGLLSKKVGIADIEIVCGLANGVDTLGERYAKEHGYPVKYFKADWDTHGKAAGIIRNGEMATYATHCVCFWDGSSKGTQDMIEKARKHELALRVIQIEPVSEPTEPHSDKPIGAIKPRASEQVSDSQKPSPANPVQTTLLPETDIEKLSRHTCHAPGCDRNIAPKYLMCPEHWGQVPKAIQADVWKHYRSGQEVDKQPSAEWMAAANAAIASLTKPALPSSITVNHAVTLIRPWPYAVTDLDKDVENRSYVPSGIKKGDWFAVHAGKSWDKGGAHWIEETFWKTIPPEPEHPTGIVAIAEYLGHFSGGDRGIKNCSWLIGEPLLDSSWFSGPYGWKLGRVVKLSEPVPCRGYQKVWSIPDDAQEALNREIERTLSTQNSSAPKSQNTINNDIEVVNLKVEGPEILKDPGTEYIGRQISGWRGQFLHASPLRNPHKVGRDGTAAEVCQKFEEENLWPALDSGTGPIYEEIQRLRKKYKAGELKRVACWCVEAGKANPCHGFSVVAAIKEES